MLETGMMVGLHQQKLHSVPETGSTQKLCSMLTRLSTAQETWGFNRKKWQKQQQQQQRQRQRQRQQQLLLKLETTVVVLAVLFVVVVDQAISYHKRHVATGLQRPSDHPHCHPRP